MARTCSKCKHSNSSTSHYCVKCGEPLETINILSFKFTKRYEVIDETELNALRNERNRLQKQISESWGIKFENWINDHKNTILWTIVTVFASAIAGWMFTTYDFSQEVSEGIEIRKDRVSGKYGIYNKGSNMLVVPYEYDSIYHRKGINYQGDWNFFFTQKNGKFGVLDSTGRITVSCELDQVLGLYNGIGILFKEGKQGLMNAYGQLILPCNYKYVLWETTPKYSSIEHPGTYVGNILPVKADKNRGWELFDRNGKKIREQYYKEAIQTGHPQLIKIREIRNDNKSLFGIVDERGQIVVPCTYQCISVFGNERAWARKNYGGPWSLITSSGKRLLTLPKGYAPYAFSEGLAAVTKEGKLGYCNTSGTFVIPMNYEPIRNKDGGYLIYHFNNGKALVSFNGKTGYIDKDGTFTPKTGDVQARK